MRYLVLLLLLAGCDIDTPLPRHCVEVGVAVDDHARITGTIEEEHMGKLDDVRNVCQDTLTQDKYGCALAVAPGEYVLWYVDDPNIRDHERCHALYEEKKHVKQ
jgi:hypothetical protein